MRMENTQVIDFSTRQEGRRQQNCRWNLSGTRDFPFSCEFCGVFQIGESSQTGE
jgi:hypothetical protein